jgi:hypothetical protein
MELMHEGRQVTDTCIEADGSGRVVVPISISLWSASCLDHLRSTWMSKLYIILTRRSNVV